MRETMSAEETLALEVVRLRKEHMERVSETSQAKIELSRCEREQTTALNAYNEAKKKFDTAMDRGMAE